MQIGILSASEVYTSASSIDLSYSDISYNQLEIDMSMIIEDPRSRLDLDPEELVVEEIEQDPIYFCENVMFKAEDRLFSVPKSGLVDHGTFFQTIFNENLTDGHSIDVTGSSKNPITLDCISKIDFHNFLRLIYPFRGVDPPSGDEHWLGILDLSTKWGFQEVRNEALVRLEHIFASPSHDRDPIRALYLCEKYDIKQHIQYQYESLVTSIAPLDHRAMLDGGIDGDTILLLTKLRDRWFCGYVWGSRGSGTGIGGILPTRVSAQSIVEEYLASLGHGGCMCDSEIVEKSRRAAEDSKLLKKINDLVSWETALITEIEKKKKAEEEVLAAEKEVGEAEERLKREEKERVKVEEARLRVEAERKAKAERVKAKKAEQEAKKEAERKAKAERVKAMKAEQEAKKEEKKRQKAEKAKKVEEENARKEEEASEGKRREAEAAAAAATEKSRLDEEAQARAEAEAEAARRMAEEEDAIVASLAKAQAAVGTHAEEEARQQREEYVAHLARELELNEGRFEAELGEFERHVTNTNGSAEGAVEGQVEAGEGENDAEADNLDDIASVTSDMSVAPSPNIGHRLEKLIILRAQKWQLEKQIEELKARDVGDDNPRMQKLVRAVEKYGRKLEKMWEKGTSMATYADKFDTSDICTINLENLNENKSGEKIEENLERMLHPANAKSLCFSIVVQGKKAMAQKQKNAIMEIRDYYSFSAYTTEDVNNRKISRTHIPEEPFGEWLAEFASQPKDSEVYVDPWA